MLHTGKNEVNSLLIALSAAAVLYVSLSILTVSRGITWADEVTYLIKSYWYVSGAVEPYSDFDATWYMPLYFYQLGWTQDLLGRGHLIGRAMSAVFGAASAVLLFYAVRTLTKSALTSALSVLIYLATPTTAYFFSTATPIATVAFLHASAMWFVIASAKRDSLLRSAALGVLFAILFFYRQNMILCAGFLFCIYLFSQPSRRSIRALAIFGGTAAVAACAALIFPDKLIFYALRLPILTPFLIEFGWLPEGLRLIETHTVSQYSLALSLDRVGLYNIWNSFLMPYAGTVFGSVLALLLVRRGDRHLMIWPIYFLSLSGLHYIGSVGYLKGAILAYTNYFIAAGSLSCGIAISRVQKILPETWRDRGAAGFAVSLVAITIAAGPSYNAFVGEPVAFPWSSIRLPGTDSDLKKVAEYRDFIDQNLPYPTKVLVIHKSDPLVHAVASLGHFVPPQVFDPPTHYRKLKPGLEESARDTLLAAIEAESLWSEEIMRRWIEHDYDTIVIEDGFDYLSQDIVSLVRENFKIVATTDAFDSRVTVYLRR